MNKKQITLIQMIGISGLVLFAGFIYFLTSRAPKPVQTPPQIPFEEIGRLASNIMLEYIGYGENKGIQDAFSSIGESLEGNPGYTNSEAEDAYHKIYNWTDETHKLLGMIEEYYYQNGYHQK